MKYLLLTLLLLSCSKDAIIEDPIITCNCEEVTEKFEPKMVNGVIQLVRIIERKPIKQNDCGLDGLKLDAHKWIECK